MKKVMLIRFSILSLVILASVTALVLERFGVWGINPHGLCPYSFVCFGLPTLRGFFTANPFIIATLLGLIILFLTVFLGRIFCGWLCPLGAIQELLYRISNGAQKGKKKYLLTAKWDKKLKFFKYFILLMNIVLASLLFQAIYMAACPVIALANIGNYILISAIILSAFLIASVFVERFACRYLCPYGALMSIILKISNKIKLPRLMLKINKDMCVNCELCSSNCPMQIDVDEKVKVTDSDCIMCFRCKAKCPLKGIDCEFCNERDGYEKK